MTIMTEPDLRFTVGVDTHKDVHVAATLDGRGGVCATASFATTAAGYQQLGTWAGSFGEIAAFGIEGTSSWGAGLSRHLEAAGFTVIEVNCTNRQHRRRHGKSDTADAIGAARLVQAGEATARPKAGTGAVEAIRVLRVTRESAKKARTQAINQLRSLLATGPTDLRAELADLRGPALVARAAELSADIDRSTPLGATTVALGHLARRYQALTVEIDALQKDLDVLVTAAAPPCLLAEHGVGIDSAAALLIAAGDNPERLHSAAAFASLCGTSPVDASSGKQQHHRLNRGGNRDANSALWRIVLAKMRWDEETQIYIAKKIGEGKTKKGAMRCLKRHLARRYWKMLTQDPNPETDDQAPEQPTITP